VSVHGFTLALPSLTNVIILYKGGSIKLVSSDPFTAPSIDPSFLSTDFDIFTLKEAVKSVRRLVAAHAWDGYIVGPTPPLANTSTDAELESYVRAGGLTVFHPTGTAAMSPKGAHWGVVDPDLKVKGVEGLRIVDGSVLVSWLPSIIIRVWGVYFDVVQPFSPNAHTQGPIYLVGERGADLIKADHAVHISKTHKILDHALGYLKGLEQLFKYCQARLVVIGKVYQNLSLRPLE
jgi:choline dehydrogenase-like flavoprotein